jgi:hypothetical protein
MKLVNKKSIFVCHLGGVVLAGWGLFLSPAVAKAQIAIPAAEISQTGDIGHRFVTGPTVNTAIDVLVGSNIVSGVGAPSFNADIAGDTVLTFTVQAEAGKSFEMNPSGDGIRFSNTIKYNADPAAGTAPTASFSWDAGIAAPAVETDFSLFGNTSGEGLQLGTVRTGLVTEPVSFTFIEFRYDYGGGPEGAALYDYFEGAVEAIMTTTNPSDPGHLVTVVPEPKHYALIVALACSGVVIVLRKQRKAIVKEG